MIVDEMRCSHLREFVNSLYFNTAIRSGNKNARN